MSKKQLYTPIELKNLTLTPTVSADTSAYLLYFKNDKLTYKNSGNTEGYYVSANLSGDTNISGLFSLSSGASINNISTDSGFTNANDTSIATTLAVKNYVLSKTGSTGDLSNYYTKSEANSNFLSANTSFYTQSEANANFLSANTSFYTQSEANANFLSANTSFYTQSEVYNTGETYSKLEIDANFLSANTSFYTQSEANVNFLSANTSIYSQPTQILYNSGNTLTGNSNLIYDGSTLSILNDTISTNTGTGSLIVKGGVGVGGNTYLAYLNQTKTISNWTATDTIFNDQDLTISRTGTSNLNQLKINEQVQRFNNTNQNLGNITLNSIYTYINNSASTINSLTSLNVIAESSSSFSALNNYTGIYLSSYSSSSGYISNIVGIELDYLNATTKGTSLNASVIGLNLKYSETYEIDTNTGSSNIYGIYIEQMYQGCTQGNAYGIYIENPGTNDPTGQNLAIYSEGRVNIASTQTSTSPTTGALVVAGGLGINENLNVSGLVRFTNTTQSTSSTTGSLVVSGGIGVGDGIYASGVIVTTTGTSSTNATTGSIISSGGIGLSGNIYSSSSGSNNGQYSYFGSSTNYIQLARTGNSGSGGSNGLLTANFEPTGGENYNAGTFILVGSNTGYKGGLVGSVTSTATSGAAIGVTGMVSCNTTTGRVGVYGWDGSSWSSTPFGSSVGQVRPGWSVGVAGVMGNTATNITTNIGIYGHATGETTNWAGYFEGDVYVDGLIYGQTKVNLDMSEPTGFVNRTDSTITYNRSTRQFSITGTYNIYIKGKLYTKTGDTATIPATYGFNFIKYDSNGNFNVSQTPWSIITDVPIAGVFVNAEGTDSFIMEERHGITMDASTHDYLHFTRGAVYKSGFAVGGFTLNSDTPSENQYSVSSGVFYDEDIENSVTGLTDGGPYTILYRTGATGDWTWSSGQTYPYFINSNSIRYNQFNGTEWVLTNITTNNRWVNHYVIATNSITSGFNIVIVPGQTIYTTLAGAQGETLASLQLGSYPFVEVVGVARIIHQFNTGYANVNGRARIVQVDRTVNQSVNITQGTSSHNSLPGLQGGIAGQYFHLTSNEYSVLTNIDIDLLDNQIAYRNSGLLSGSTNLLYNNTSVSILNTTPSTGVTSGALIVSGGIGVSGSSWFGNRITITGNTLRVTENRTITNSGDTGLKGEICWDSNYIYVCTDTNTWKRSTLAGW